MRPRICLHYADAPRAQALLAGPAPVLGVVGFGAPRPAGLAPAMPYVDAPLRGLDGAAHYEIWTTEGALSPFAAGPVRGMRGKDIAFGAVVLEERAGEGMAAAAQRAYLAIFDYLAASGVNVPVRFWNYLTRILDDEQGMERYRHFNAGRQRAFLARLQQALPPAASGVGGMGAASVVYFLAGLEAARPVENPRQVSAYDYPPQYGPKSPSFSRAGVLGGQVFISGTASIVGHETRHAGDVLAQARETLENLRALSEAAGFSGNFASEAGWVFKVYLRDPADVTRVAPLLDEALGEQSAKLYLHGVVCRADLALEIEAFKHALP